MNIFSQFVERARSSRKHIVLAEGEDTRMLTAASMATRDGIADVTVIGGRAQIEACAAEHSLDIELVSILDPSRCKEIDQYASALLRARKHKGMTEDESRVAILNPLNLANILTRTGVCDGSVAGAVYSTADVVRTAFQLIGKDDGYDLVSSFFIMAFDHPFHPDLEIMVFADCALVIEPTPAELAQIAIVSADSARNFVGIEPTLAMLSFSTDGSAEHSLVDKVVEATRLVQQMRPDLDVVGDIQLDAAIIPEILHRKSNKMQLDGPANVLIFPGLESGNIGYKLVERFARAEAIGPILQGLQKPANDLSRGCKVEDIYKIITVTALQAQNM